MSLIGDYIGERLKAGEDIPIPTVSLAVRLLGGDAFYHEFISNHHYTLRLLLWTEKHSEEILTKLSTPQIVEARRLAMLPFD